MVGCLYKALLRKEGATHLQKLRNLKPEQLSSISVRKECLARKFMVLWKEPPSYSTVKKWAAEFKTGERAFEMIYGLAAPKMPPLRKMSRSYTSWSCDRRRDLQNIASEVGISFGQYNQS